MNKKFALVTGGSRGIGKAISNKLARNGMSVAIVYSKSTDDADQTLNELLNISSLDHMIIKANLSEPEDIKKLMQKVHDCYGKLDLLVNNAGGTTFINHDELKDLTFDIFDDIYKVHLRGSFLCIREAEILLRESVDPMIINISSIASISAIGSNIAYCAIKAAINNMTKSLARALAPQIRVNSISPGLTDTRLTRDWTDYKNEQIDKIPLGRLGKCEDIADAVLTLYNNFKFVTGHNLIIDGGRILN